MRIRGARHEDCPELAQIYNEAIESGRITMDTHPVDGGFFEKILTASHREAIVVGDLGSQVIGWGVVKRYSERQGYQYACETSVYVARTHWRHGYGSELLQAVITRAEAMGYRHLVAKILAVNKSSIRFHERFNFEVVGRQHAIGFLNGVWHDVVIMQYVKDHSQHRNSMEDSTQ
jgi:phosphinothricin acetyltransferase